MIIVFWFLGAFTAFLVILTGVDAVDITDVRLGCPFTRWNICVDDGQGLSLHEEIVPAFQPIDSNSVVSVVPTPYVPISDTLEESSAPLVDMSDGMHGGTNVDPNNDLIQVVKTGEGNRGIAHVDLGPDEIGYLSGNEVNGVVGKFLAIEGPHHGDYPIVDGQYMRVKKTQGGKKIICDDYNAQKKHPGWIVTGIIGISC